jgi:preprotein translocase subunit SecG
MTTSSLLLGSLLLGSLGSAALGWLMFLLSVFLILLILVQRGKGGGLTGALGGPGGQSAFGSKAGDTFTVITAVSAIIWGLVCAIAMYSLGVPPLTAEDVEYQIEEQTPVLMAPGDDVDSSGTAAGLSGLLSDETGGDVTQPTGGDATDTAPATGTPSAELTPVEATTEESGQTDGSKADPPKSTAE